MMAISTLASGPAAATATMDSLPPRRRRKLTGTGLAQPNNAPPNISIKAGTRMVPMGSTWRSGLSDSRPAILAVSSPKYRAA